MENISTKWINLIYSACIFVNHFAFGITSNTLWPALVDLSKIYQVSEETIYYLATFSSLGYLIGSLSGIIYKWLNRQFVLICMTSLIALTMAFVPYYGSIYLLFTAVTLNGIGGGSWDSSNNIWLVEMWPKKHASVMQSSQFMYGLGLIISPTLISPYISGNSTNTTTEMRIDSLRTPFTTVGIIQIIIPIILLILFFTRKYKKSNDNDNSNDYEDMQVISTQPNYQNQSLRKFKLILVALLLGCYDAAELAYFYNSSTMLQHLQISASEAAHILSVLSATYTIGRLITAVISLKLTPDFIMTYHFIIIIISQSLLYINRHNTTIIYISTALLGYGFSAMWPAILAFTERHFRLSNRIGTLLFFFAGLATIFTPFLIGRYLEEWPEVLFIFEASYIAISIILFVTVKLLIIIRP